VHCAFISHKFLARNHLLTSLLLSAGRRGATVRAGRLRTEKMRGAMHFIQRPRSAAGSPSRRRTVAAVAGPQFRSTPGSLCMMALFCWTRSPAHGGFICCR
jgi:hypothetical protein